MRRGRFGWSEAGLMALGAFLLLVDPAVPKEGAGNAQKAVTEKPDQGAQIEKPAELDHGALFDRMATRFGAFAVVAGVAYPVWLASKGLWQARAFDLPSLVASPGTMWVSIVLGWLMGAVSLLLGLSVLQPMITFFNAVTQDVRWYLGIFFSVVIVAIFFLYATILAAVWMSDDVKPLFGDLGKILENIEICQVERLQGQVCSDILERCAAERMSGMESCRQVARQYLQELRPATGRNP